MTAYFAASFFIILFLKKLFLAEYDISITGFSTAIIGALVVAKVVVILDATPLGNLFKNGPLFRNILYRSLLYSFFVGVVVFIERVFHVRHQVVGLKAALVSVVENRDMNHFWATIICIILVFIGYNLTTAINSHLGKGGLSRLLFSHNIPPKN